MDIHIRSLYKTSVQAQSCYFDSHFLSMILARVFDNCNQGHDLLQREGNELPPLENVGGCGLQVLYGAFKTAFQAMYWWLDKILKAM